MRNGKEGEMRPGGSVFFGLINICINRKCYFADHAPYNNTNCYSEYEHMFDDVHSLYFILRHLVGLISGFLRSYGADSGQVTGIW